MFNLKALFTRALLALTLAIGSGAALAGPTYHVSINTLAFAGGTGYLDLVFTGLGNAAPAIATIGNFSGDFAAGSATSGQASGDLASGVVIQNGPDTNEFLQLLNFGGTFGFDVSFTGADTDGMAGSLFGVALINEAFNAYLGIDGNIATIGLQPGVADTLSPANAFASISVVTAAVPEPSAWLLLATGLLLLAFTAQRRSAR